MGNWSYSSMRYLSDMDDGCQLLLVGVDFSMN